MRRALSLRTLLFTLLIALSAVPVLLLGARIKGPALQRELDAVVDKHFLVARSLAGELERYASELETTFRTATAMALAGTDTSNLANLLRILQFRHICIVDASGSLLATISPGPSEPIPGYLPSALFKKVLELNGGLNRVVLSGVLPDQDRQPIILMIMSLPNGQFSVGVLSTEYFVTTQRAVQFGSKGHAVIVDQYGKVLAHPRDDWRLSMKDLSAIEPVRLLGARRFGTTNFFSPAVNATMVAGFAPVKGAKWGVLVAQPLRELQDSVTSLLRETMVITGFGIMLAAILSWWLAGFLSRPAVAVTQAAKNMVLAKSAIQVTLSKNAPAEFRSLADSFNRMLSHINDVYKALTASEKRFRDFAETAADWFWELDNNLRFIYLSERYHEIVNAVPEDALLRSHEELFESRIENPVQLLSYQEAIRLRKPFRDIEISWRLPSGDLKVQQLNGVPILNDKGVFRGFRGSGTDITESRSLAEQLTYQAGHDELTGLINRREFKRRLVAAIEEARASHSEHCLAFFDLDRFKAVNDKCGHEAGDELLRQLGRLFAEHMREGDTVARLGGDEFSLLLLNCPLLTALGIIKHLQQVIAEYDFVWGREVMRVGASFGVVPVTRTGENMTVLLKQADIACYSAKGAGRNLIHIHSEPHINASEDRANLA